MWQNWFSNFLRIAFCLPPGRWGVYWNALKAPAELCLRNLKNRLAKFACLSLVPLFLFLSLCFGFVLQCNTLCRTQTAHIRRTCCLQKLQTSKTTLWLESMIVVQGLYLWECAEEAGFESLQTSRRTVRNLCLLHFHLALLTDCAFEEVSFLFPHRDTALWLDYSSAPPSLF